MPNKIKSEITSSKLNTRKQMRARQSSSSSGTEIVSNKGKGKMSKRRWQENKARQIFRKANISYPLIRIRALFSCYLRLPFCLITDEIVKRLSSNQNFIAPYYLYQYLNFYEKGLAGVDRLDLCHMPLIYLKIERF